jgi:uncharacterized membrane protein (DUF2068 family)
MQVSTVSVRTVAVFEALKGLIVIVAGFGLFSLIHHNAEHVAEQLVRHMHLDPARHYPRVFIEAAAQFGNVHRWLLALLAGCYATLRMLEAWGLWYQRIWAEWLAAISGGIYLPFEIYELTKGLSAIRMTTFLVNVLVVVVMIYALYSRRRQVARA